jgi:hypothetical protein
MVSPGSNGVSLMALSMWGTPASFDSSRPQASLILCCQPGVASARTGVSPLQHVLATVGTPPLSPASYTNAVSILVGPAATTVDTVIDTASSFASMPFRVAADLIGTGAAVFNPFACGMATAAGGLLQAAGMPPFVTGLPHTLVAVVAGAANLAAFAIRTLIPPNHPSMQGKPQVTASRSAKIPGQAQTQVRAEASSRLPQAHPTQAR